MKSVKKNIKKIDSQEKTPAILFLGGLKNLFLTSLLGATFLLVWVVYATIALMGE